MMKKGRGDREGKGKRKDGWMDGRMERHKLGRKLVCKLGRKLVS